MSEWIKRPPENPPPGWDLEIPNGRVSVSTASGDRWFLWGLVDGGEYSPHKTEEPPLREALQAFRQRLLDNIAAIDDVLLGATCSLQAEADPVAAASTLKNASMSTEGR